MPISPAYSLQSRDFAKLKGNHCARAAGSDLCRGFRAIRAGPGSNKELHAATLLVGSRSGASPDDAVRFDQLKCDVTDAEIDRAFAAVTADTVAKILYTSGSTDEPKGVINTQRMLCCNQQAKAQLWPFLETSPPVIVDWLPWNHTFGGNHNFNLILRNGGTLYIDDGKTGPGAFRAQCPQPARDLADRLFQCAARLRDAGRGTAHAMRFSVATSSGASRSFSTRPPRFPSICGRR